MSLVPYTVVVATESDGVNNRNVVTGAQIYVAIYPDDTPAEIYEDDAGASLIAQPALSDSAGERTFYLRTGEYTFTVSGVERRVTIAKTKIHELNSVAELRLAKKDRHDKARTAGYYVAGDGGASEYWYDATDTTTADDGGGVIVASDGARWKLIPVNNSVSLSQFGIDPSDCFSSLLRMHNFANSSLCDVIVVGNYPVTFISTIPVKTKSDYSRCTLTVSNSTSITTCFDIQQTESSIVISSPSATEFKKGATFLTALTDQPKGFISINSTDIYLMRNGTDAVYKRDVSYHTGDGKLAHSLTFDWSSISTLTVKKPESYTLDFYAPTLIVANCTISNFILCGRNQTTVFGARITNNRSIAGAPIVTYINPQLVMDCVLDGVFGDALTGISGANGSTYIYSGGSCLRPTVLNLRCGGEWGAIDGNVYRDLFVDNCTVSRVGCHASAVNVTVTNTVITEKAIQVSGSGLLLVKNCSKVITGQPGADGGIGALVDLREDYGGEWAGDIVVEDFSISCGAANLTDAQFAVVRLNFKGNVNYGAPLNMAQSITINRGTITASNNASSNISMYLVEVFRYTDNQAHIVRTMPERISIKDVTVIVPSGSPVTSVRPYRSPRIDSTNVSGNTKITVDNFKFPIPVSSLPASQLGRTIRVEATSGEISGATHDEFYELKNMSVDAIFRAPATWSLSCVNCDVYNLENFFNTIHGNGYTEARNSRLYPGRYSGTAPKAYFNCEAKQGGGSTAVMLSGGFKRSVGNSIQAGVVMTFAVPRTKTEFVNGFYDATYYEPL